MTVTNEDIRQELEEKMKNSPMYEHSPAKLIYGMLGKVEGVKVLELGCGAKEVPRDLSFLIGGISNLPEIARFLSSIGADVTGVDIRPSPDEPYNHVVMDLTRESLVDRFGEESFDVVTSQQFFNSQALIDTLSMSLYGRPCGPYFTDHENFCRRICREVNQVTRNNGLFLTHTGEIFFCDGPKILQESGFGLVKDRERSSNYQTWKKKK